jgi:hypothetical protein
MEHLRGAAQQAHDAAERRERLGKSGAVVAHKLQAAERMVQQSAQIMAAETLDSAGRAVRLAAQADTALDTRSRLRRELFRTVADGRIAAGAAMELAEYVVQLERTVYHLARAAHYWSAPEDHLQAEDPADTPDEPPRERLG